jgi:NAD(P)-dependent dehydrogenase (short-subunit alcohol dehydrogenase family)
MVQTQPAELTMPQETALIIGVGEGLSAALARRFAREGMRVAPAARKIDKLDVSTWQWLLE